MSRLCECGCGEPVANRFKRGHVRRGSGEPIDRKYSIDPDTECWVWQRGTSRGYAYTADPRTPNKTSRAHRVLYELHVGPIPEGLALDHLCRNTLCVNPEHLEPVTDRVNTMRGDAVSAVNARKTHCKAGHEHTPENTRVDPKSGRRACRICQTIWQRQYRRRQASK